jgi:hypothetical protein
MLVVISYYKLSMTDWVYLSPSLFIKSFTFENVKPTIQGGPDITCQKNSGSFEGSNKSKKPHFVRSKIMGIN